MRTYNGHFNQGIPISPRGGIIEHCENPKWQMGVVGGKKVALEAAKPISIESVMFQDHFNLIRSLWRDSDFSAAKAIIQKN